MRPRGWCVNVFLNECLFFSSSRSRNRCPPFPLSFEGEHVIVSLRASALVNVNDFFFRGSRSIISPFLFSSCSIASLLHLLSRGGSALSDALSFSLPRLTLTSHCSKSPGANEKARRALRRSRESSNFQRRAMDADRLRRAIDNLVFLPSLREGNSASPSPALAAVAVAAAAARERRG